MTIPATEPVVPATPSLATAPVVPVTPPVEPVVPGADDSAATIARLEADLKAARAEAGKSRVNAKQTAADEARAELAQTIGKALGLAQGDELTDPAKLTEQLTAAGADARTAKVELAIYRAASEAGGDPAALLDSRTFLAKLADVDPSDGAAITAAIAAAITENPRLGVASASAPPVVPGMRPNPAQGGSAQPPLGIAAQIAAAAAAGDHRTTIRLKSAQALAPQT